MSRPTITILNGPNLDRLGTREPGIYGRETLSDIEAACRHRAEAGGFSVSFRQTSHEGALVEFVHAAADDPSVVGVIVNAGAYTHTSIALHDALRLLKVPVVEVHLSNTHTREAFRHVSYVSPVATGIVMGFGSLSYLLAVDAVMHRAAASAA